MDVHRGELVERNLEQAQGSSLIPFDCHNLSKTSQSFHQREVILRSHCETEVYSGPSKGRLRIVHSRVQVCKSLKAKACAFGVHVQLREHPLKR
jgi:hypothetical protein